MTDADRPDEPRREGGHQEHRPAPRPGEAAPGGPVPVRRAMTGPAAGSGAPAAESGRRFQAGGETWIARPMGESAIGHGAGARAYLVAVRFFRAEDDVPVSEVLIPRGRFELLYDEELEELLRRATPLAPAPEPEDREPPRAHTEEPDDLPPPDA